MHFPMLNLTATKKTSRIEQDQRVQSPELAAGLASQPDKINIITPEYSTQLEVGVYALLLRVLICRGVLQFSYRKLQL